MLLKFCFDLTRNEDGSVDDEKLTDLHQPSLRTRVFKSCVLLLKTPTQVVIFGSLLPIFLYICAYAIDAAITYEVLANIFTSQNGFFKLQFQDMCTVGFNQMRSVWLLAMALHVYVQLWASTCRKLSWRPIHGIWGVPEFLLSALASVMMLAQLRTKAFRDARILSVFEIVDSRKLQAIKYHWNLGIRGYGHVSLGGAFIDLKFFVFLIALLYVGIWVRELHNYYSRSRASSYQRHRASSLQTKTPVSYAAGILWPVGAMCIHWSSDYFCIKPPPPIPPVPRQTMQSSCSTSTKTDSRASSSRMNQTINRHPPSVLSSFMMDNATFASIQSQMANLHDRHDDDVDASIAFLDLVAMSDPIVYFDLIKGRSGGRRRLLGYYQLHHNPEKKLVLLPCEVVNAPQFRLHNDLELVCTVRSSELRFADLIHCG